MYEQTGEGSIVKTDIQTGFKQRAYRSATIAGETAAWKTGLFLGLTTHPAISRGMARPTQMEERGFNTGGGELTARVLQGLVVRVCAAPGATRLVEHIAFFGVRTAPGGDSWGIG